MVCFHREVKEKENLQNDKMKDKHSHTASHGSLPTVSKAGTRVGAPPPPFLLIVLSSENWKPD